ncbi:S-layer family protein, partial [Polynucleobacter sp. UK-Kesae-W10]|uniref:beta strand repeat-containing protein n=1 Tax=Polynucleobacter sp. UK-Kesae-W10 TaxID=1819738 RepID=UPI001C0D643A
ITNAPTSTSNAATYALTYASGLSSTNYTFNPASSAVNYVVNPASLSIAISKVYNGDTGFTNANTYSLSGSTYNSDAMPTIASGSAAVSSANAASYSNFATNSFVLSNANYTLTGGAVAATIDSKVITYTTTGATSTYGALATLSTPTFAGLVGSDNPGASVNLYSGSTPVSFSATTNAGTYAQQVAITNGNYQIAGTGNTIGNLVISPAALLISGANNTPSYNGSIQINTGATVSLNGGNASAISGTTVSTGIGAQTFTLSGYAIGLNANSTPIADSLSITPNALSGAIAGNYSISYSNGSLAIGKANLSLTGTQTYNGTATIAGSSLTITGVGGQTFTGSGTADLASKNVQTNQQLADVNSLVLTPNGNFLLSNYNTINVANTSVSITPLAVTLTAPSITKVYDGGYTYNMTAANLATMSSQLVGGDSVTAASVVFSGNNPNVGSNKSVSLNSATISDGNSGSNYTVTLANSNTSLITPASLTITANNASKFVTQADTAGFNGVVYSGFVNGETASTALGGTLTVIRGNASTNSAGLYTGVLTPGGLTANNGNYTITPAAGNFTIVPADQLLVQVTPVTTTYGTAPTYSATAKYLSCSVSGCPPSGSVNIIHTLSPVITGNQFTVSDGAGGIASFTIAPVASSTSGSSNTNVGGYQLATANITNTSINFNNTIVLTGTLTVSPLTLAVDQLGVSGISKIYNGTTAISGLTLNTSAATSSIKSGDAVVITGTGTYANANVGSSKSVTVSVGLTGNDAGNYVLSSNQLTANIGTITQLASVTYTGTSGGNWSNASNWQGGAIPTLSNVAAVIIPTDKTVVYDTANMTALTPTSAITDNGSISFTSGLPITFANTISGSGSINQSGGGTLTLSGNNNYSGGTYINSSRLIIGSSAALGIGTVNSNGGTISVDSGVTSLPSLMVDGPVTLASNITTANNQTYNGAVTLGAGNAVGGTITPMVLSSINGNITFNNTLSAGDNSLGAKRSLTINVGSNGSVTFNDRVGAAIAGTAYNQALYNAFQNGTAGQSIYQLVVNAGSVQAPGSILIKADITTFETQTFTGNVKIGDNGSNGMVRTLLSEDPTITFNNLVDDTSAGTHTLLVRAISIQPGLTSAVNINQAVGSIAPLLALDIKTGTQTPYEANPVITDTYGYSGGINIVGNVSTVGNQTYTANTISLGSSSQAEHQIFATDGGVISFNVGGAGGGIASSNQMPIDLMMNGGSISGLNGAGISYNNIGDTTSSGVNGSGSLGVSSSLGGGANVAGALQNALKMELHQLASETAYNQSSGSVTVGAPTLDCVVRLEANNPWCMR